MTDSYEGNGDFSVYNDDDDYGKQRKGVGGGGGANVGPGGAHNGDNHCPVGGGATGDSVHLNDKANEYIRDCLTEKNRMDRKFPIAEKLLDCEIEKVQTTGRIPTREQKYADIYREKPLRVSQKVLVPIREHPKFNFVGKLLGPKGNSLRRLQEETLCKMTVLGRNSMRDRVKEEELRASKDPKYAHLNSDLHVEISTIAPPAEAFARLAYAMAELRKYLIPDSNDVIRQEQLRELMDNTGISDNDGNKSSSAYNKKMSHQIGQNNSNNSMMGSGVGGVGIGGGGVMSSAGGGVNSATGGGNNLVGMNNKNLPHHGGGSGGGGGYRSQQQPQQQMSFNKNVIAPKQKVMSILEKARTAMDETYGRGYDDHMTYEAPSYDSYGYGHPQSAHGGAQNTANIGGGGGGGGGGGVAGSMGWRGPYESNEYEPDYNRSRDYSQHSPSYGVAGNVAAGQTNPNAGLNPNHNRSHVNRNDLQNETITRGTRMGTCFTTNNGIMNAQQLNDSLKIKQQHLQTQQQQQQLAALTANNNRTPPQATSNPSAANLLFVRPANPTIHVNKMPFVPVQFI